MRSETHRIVERHEFGLQKIRDDGSEGADGELHEMARVHDIALIVALERVQSCAPRHSGRCCEKGVGPRGAEDKCGCFGARLVWLPLSCDNRLRPGLCDTAVCDTARVTPSLGVSARERVLQRWGKGRVALASWQRPEKHRSKAQIFVTVPIYIRRSGGGAIPKHLRIRAEQVRLDISLLLPPATRARDRNAHRPLLRAPCITTR